KRGMKSETSGTAEGDNIIAGTGNESRTNFDPNRGRNQPFRFAGACYECGSHEHRKVNCPRFSNNGGNNGGGRGNWNNTGFNNQRQNWNNNAGGNANQNWQSNNNTGQNQGGNAPNQGGYQGNRWQDNNQWRDWYEQPYQGNQRYQPQSQSTGNWNNNAGNPNYRPPTQQNQGSAGNNNASPPGVRVIGISE
ncbi:MAG: hypothetical protein GY820_28475, partial [Gammaproteobacteria bacterium]|nr:hypothetical protein [Gammaproteobacteria bacterium]